nr:hypothetical protein [Tanacetum cinerariifolium]
SSYGYLFKHLSAKFIPRRKFNELAKNLEEIMMKSLPKLVDDCIKVDSLVRSYMTGHILHVHSAKDTPTSVQEQQYQLYLTMKDDPQLQKDDVSIWFALKIKFKRLQVATTPCRPFALCPSGQDDPYSNAHPKGSIVQKGIIQLSMERLSLEVYLLAKSMKVNQIHQHQVIKNNLMILISGQILMP